MCDVQPFVFFILSVRIWPSKIIRSWSVDDQFSTFQLRGARSPSSSRVLEQIGILSIGWSKINDEITARFAWTQRISIDIEEIDFSYHREQHHSAIWMDGTAFLQFISSPTFIRNDTKILGNEGRISNKHRLRDYTKEHRHIEIVVPIFRINLFKRTRDRWNGRDKKIIDEEGGSWTASRFSKKIGWICGRRGRVKKGVDPDPGEIEENEEGNVCTRAPPEHPLSTHSARRIRISRSICTISPVYIYIYTRPTSAISTRSASFHLGSTLASPIV